MGRRWTEEEDAELLRLRTHVFPGCEVGQYHRKKIGGLSAIAKALGRAKSSVQIRLLHLAALDEGDCIMLGGRKFYRPRKKP
jgi:hypothetical protein